MAFLSYSKIDKQALSERMQENFERLEDFDIYHCLLDGNLLAATKFIAANGALPRSFIRWLQLCDGGLLFDTTLLSSKEYDEDLDLSFSSFGELNSDEVFAEFGLPTDYFIFAVRSYGDPICFKKDSADEHVYLWNKEERFFEEIWDTFEDWLTEEIDTGIQLIAEDYLEPLEIKLNGGEDGGY